MDIYDFEDFQQKVAKFSVSPYAEAITTLAGLSPQVVGIATRLGSSYASLRGTVQLLTTNEDNEIVDETTPARETIARSAVVGAWNSIGSAVERLISLRRALSSDGVSRPVERYPHQYSLEGTLNYCGTVTPSLIASGDMTNNGFSVMLPSNIDEYSTGGEGIHVIPLNVRMSEPIYRGVFTADGELGRAYSEEGQEFSTGSLPRLGSLGVVTAAYAVLSSTNTRTLVRLLYEITQETNYAITHKYYEQNVGSDMSLIGGGYLYKSIESAATSEISAATAYDTLKIVTRGLTKQVHMKTRRIFFPATSAESVVFDPFDPREVFTQAYEAASAILELMEAMGYTSGLTEDDRQVLTQ